MRSKLNIMRVLLLVVILFVIGCASNGAKNARKFYESGDYAKALKEFESVDMAKSEPEVHLLKGRILKALNKKREAAASIKVYFDTLGDNLDAATIAKRYPSLLTASREYFDLLVPFSMSLWSANGYRNAKIDFPDEAFKAVATALMKTQKYVESREPTLLLGKCYLLVDDFTQAYKAFNYFLRENSEDAWAMKWKADIERELAMTMTDKRKAYRWNKLALSHYDYAINLIEDEACFYHARGVYYTFQGDDDKALRDFRKALEIDKKFAPAYFDIGISQNSSGRKKQAEKNFLKAIEFAPEFPEPYYHLGFMYYTDIAKTRDGKQRETLTKKAKATLRKLLELMPGSCDIWALLGDVVSKAPFDYDFKIYRINFTIPSERDYKKLKAMCDGPYEAFGMAVKCDPNNPNANYRFGYTLGLLKQWKKADEHLTKAIKVSDDSDSQHWMYWFTRGKFRQREAMYIDYDKGSEKEYQRLSKLAIADYRETWKRHKVHATNQAIARGDITRPGQKFTYTRMNNIDFSCIAALWSFTCRMIDDKDGLEELNKARAETLGSGGGRRRR